MKKIFAIVLALAAVITLAACAGGNKENSDTSNTAAPVQDGPVQAAEPAAAQPAVPADGSVYVGEWYDYMSQRAGMSIKKADDGSFDVLIQWGSSAWESVEWVMHAAFDPETGKLTYTDGSERIVTYYDDSANPEVQILYTDSAGSFRFSTDRVTWTDDKDPEVSDERIFLRIGENGASDVPEDLKFIGFYTMDDGSSLDIFYNPDGSFKVDMSITRLAQFEGGSGIYDPLWDTIIVTATDPSENQIEFKISKKDDGGKKVEVTNSTWDLLPTGESFDFE